MITPHAIHKTFALGQLLGGTRQFGNVWITWTPSTTQASVEVSVTMGGTIVADKTLTPTDKQMAYNIQVGSDTAQGVLEGTFSGAGTNGHLNGTLSWTVEGSSGTFKGLIGVW
jgi:hypothetical protein